MPDGSSFFELTRGCPYKCSYCLYSKNYKITREIPFEILINILKDEQFSKILSELYILSPALNTTKKFSQKLDQLTRLNHTIRLHSEMRAGGIEKKLARSLYAAGFRSMEVGLQTTNIDSLARVGRKSIPEKELEGMRHLQDAGIDLKIGLMPGLPGDTIDSFLSMTDTLVQSGFKDSIELYPLMILPGTLIRDYANTGGINYLKKPPYYYNFGWGMSFDDLRFITCYLENATGFSHIIRKLPDFTHHDHGLYCRGIRINGDDLLNWNTDYTDCIETNVFDYYIEVRNQQILDKGMAELLRHLPRHQLFNIVLYNTNFIIDEKTIVDLLQNMEDDNIMQRINIFHDWRDGTRIRFYQVFDVYERYCQAKGLFTFVTPIFQVNKKNIHNLNLINDSEDNILITRGIYNDIKKYIRKFVDSIDSVAFEDVSEQKEFYNMIGFDFMQLPYTFKVITW